MPPVRQPFRNEGVFASAAPAVAGKDSAIIDPSEPVANCRERLVPRAFGRSFNEGMRILRATLASAMKKRILSTRCLSVLFWLAPLLCAQNPDELLVVRLCNTGLHQTAGNTATVPDGAKSNCYS